MFLQRMKKKATWIPNYTQGRDYRSHAWNDNVHMIDMTLWMISDFTLSHVYCDKIPWPLWHTVTFSLWFIRPGSSLCGGSDFFIVPVLCNCDLDLAQGRVIIICYGFDGNFLNLLNQGLSLKIQDRKYLLVCLECDFEALSTLFVSCQVQ